MAVEIVPRWEWRTFGEAGAAFADLTVDRVQDSRELYLLSAHADTSVKLRDGLVDVKGLLAVDGDGLEQWMPLVKRPFPLPRDDVARLLTRLRVEAPPLARDDYPLEALGAVVRPIDALRVVEVDKRRTRYTVGGCMAEVCEISTESGPTSTLAVEAEDPAAVMEVLRSRGLAGRANVCMARGLKTLTGFGATRYAVIDVGTNSVKLHVGERRADGTWRTAADRSVVTRLGEGLDATGALGPEPMRRTLEAIASLAAEARAAGAAEIAAVGTAGLRAGSNAAEFLAAVDHRCGVRVATIPGEEEARLAYVAARSGLGLARGALAVFDTGGGSSQFTFGHDAVVQEQFSVPVGAVRLTERHGLDRAVSEAQLRDALDAIASELHRLDGRAVPDVLAAMGGAVTNLAAVEHELAEYDPDVVQGTRLDRAAIDRQIERYRTRTADERRSIVGLQPARAEVILAGACVVRVVMTKLGCESLLVSDRGLRNGVIADRFALGPPVG